MKQRLLAFNQLRNNQIVKHWFVIQLALSQKQLKAANEQISDLKERLMTIRESHDDIKENFDKVSKEVKVCRAQAVCNTVPARATGSSRFESRKSPPLLRAKIPENSRYLMQTNTPLYTLSANINLTNSHHLSIAMSNINSLRLSPSNLTTALSTSRRPRVRSISKQILQTQTVTAYLHNKSYVT